MKKTKVGKTKTVFKGIIFRIKQAPVVLPSGKKTTFEYCERPASASVLAFNDKGELLMIRERRVGYNKNVWFLPGGRVDHAGETPRTAIIREMREEAGYRAKKIKLLHTKSPGSTLIWDIYIFVGKDLVRDPLPQEDGEHTRPVFVPFKKAVQMALDGTIDNEFIAYSIIRFDYMLKHGQFKW
ncbi:MAG: NUDIX hydrolase [bacterium]|nr:NUDIX hydrolase [bacterium]